MNPRQLVPWFAGAALIALPFVYRDPYHLHILILILIWAFAYTSYNLSDVTIGQPRTLIADFDQCSAVPSPKNNNQCKRAWGSLHSGGTLNFAFADGSVRTISKNIDMNFVMPALGSIGNGETISGDF